VGRLGGALLIDRTEDARMLQHLRMVPGLRVVQATTADEVQRMAALPDYAFKVALISTAFQLPELEPLVEPLRERFKLHSLSGIVFGPRPTAQLRAYLAELGFMLALWRPFDDNALRFQINRALAGGPRMGPTRRELRVPMDCHARVTSGNRAKDAIIYSLSQSGAFLATPCPSAKGARVEVDLQLPDRPLSLSARVMHTNVPGNLQRPGAPVGMGVRFLDASHHAQHELACVVEARRRTLHL
jgi:hypothetical protein